MWIVRLYENNDYSPDDLIDVYLFSTKKKVLDFIKKDLDMKYDRSWGWWFKSTSIRVTKAYYRLIELDKGLTKPK